IPLDPGIDAVLEDADPAVYGDLVPRLLNSLSQAGECMLILDDVDRVAGRPCHDLVAYVCEHLPPGARLVLGCRSALALPLGRLRARRLLLELGPSDLSLSRGQAQTLFEAVSTPVAADAFELLHAQTQGWPAGIYLAALAAHGSSDPDATVREFDG